MRIRFGEFEAVIDKCEADLKQSLVKKNRAQGKLVKVQDKAKKGEAIKAEMLVNEEKLKNQYMVHALRWNPNQSVGQGNT